MIFIIIGKDPWTKLALRSQINWLKAFIAAPPWLRIYKSLVILRTKDGSDESFILLYTRDRNFNR